MAIELRDRAQVFWLLSRLQWVFNGKGKLGRIDPQG